MLATMFIHTSALTHSIMSFSSKFSEEGKQWIEEWTKRTSLSQGKTGLTTCGLTHGKRRN